MIGPDILKVGRFVLLNAVCTDENKNEIIQNVWVSADNILMMEEVLTKEEKTNTVVTIKENIKIPVVNDVHDIIKGCLKEEVKK